MGYTRRQFVNAAFEEIGMAAYTFDLTPDMLQSAGRRLDAMMADWNARGIRLGYPIPSTPEGNDLDTETGVPDMAYRATIANLAVEIAGGYGKTPSPSTQRAAKSGLNSLLIHFSAPLERQLQQLPAGAGNKPWIGGDPFLPAPVDPLVAGPDGPLEYN